MTARRAGASAVALTVLSVGVLLVMVMFAARSGPQRIYAGPLHDPNVRPAYPSYTLPTRPSRPNGNPGQGFFHSDPLFQAIGLVLEVAFGVLALWLLYRGLVRLAGWLRLLRWRPRRTVTVPVEFDVLDDPEPVVAELRRGADEQFDLLLSGAPRNAIVACWDRFEDYAERAGASRHPWETSSEFILRLLESVSADTDAVSRLEALYREARFSAHEMDEGRRQAAVDALRAIHAALGIGVRS